MQKLIRNLLPGEKIIVSDATTLPARSIRVEVTRVEEGSIGPISGRRTWNAFFEPPLKFGSWTHITGYSDDKVRVVR